MADLSNSTFFPITAEESDADSPFNITMAQRFGKSINFLKAQADALERIDIIAYAALAVRDI